MPATVEDRDVIAIAQRYSLPPAVLEGIVKAQGTSPTFNVPVATMGAYGLSLSEIQADPLLAVEAIARQLQQSFQQYGGWEQALSQVLAGDPQAYQSPTSSLGGIVYSVLGSAAADPTFGLSGFRPMNLSAFQAAATSLQHHLTSLQSSGGVVRPETTAAFTQAVGRVAFETDATLQQTATDILAAMSKQSGQNFPATAANLALIATMARGEGMNPAYNNPLASTEGQGVGTVPGTPGVNIYGSYQQGIDATARTFLNGNYSALVQHMQSGADLASMARDPQVQANLRTWQGGSSEDVNNLLALQNQSGSSGGAGTITAALQSAAQNNGQSYTAGQCTWYAARSLGYIPAGLGDAENWAKNAADAGMQVDETPAVGTAVVYGPGGAYSPQYGHVAVVKAVNPDGTFTVSEMNADGQYVADERVSTMQGVIGFIHPPQNTDMTQAVPWLKQQTQTTTQQQGPNAASPASSSAASQNPAASRAADREVNPADVAEFATQLKSAGLDAQTFTALYPDFAATQRMLASTGAPQGPVLVDEFIQAAQEIQQQGGTVNQNTLTAWARAQPHAVHPGVTVGQVRDAAQMAMLASVQHTGRAPTTSEAARFVSGGLGWKEVNAYYQQQAQASQAPPPPRAQPAVTAGPDGGPSVGAQPTPQPQPAAAVASGEVQQRQQDRGA